MRDLRDVLLEEVEERLSDEEEQGEAAARFGRDSQGFNQALGAEEALRGLAAWLKEEMGAQSRTDRDGP